MLDLAPEIQLRILQFSSPGDLSSLSRVHTSLRDVAEYVLYSHIRVEWTLSLIEMARFREWWPSTSTKDGLLVHTLTTNVRKASMVKALYFELCPGHCTHSILGTVAGPTLDKLAEALEKTPNLWDLRVICNTADYLSERRFRKLSGPSRIQHRS
jgi:hypothetical protein